MSRNGELLAVPLGYELPPYPLSEAWLTSYPRSAWLGLVEYQLRNMFPDASAADLALTARTLAPFELAQPAQR